MKYLPIFSVLLYLFSPTFVYSAGDIRLEIEQMQRNAEYDRNESYKEDRIDVDYAGNIIRQSSGQTGTVSRLDGAYPDREPNGYYGAVETTFPGPTGYYDVYIMYIDEKDSSWEFIAQELGKIETKHPIVAQRYKDALNKGIELLGGNGTLSFSLNDKNDQFFIISDKVPSGSSMFAYRHVCKSIKMVEGEKIYGQYNRSDNWIELGRMDYLEFKPASGPSNDSGCVVEKESPSVITSQNTLSKRPSRPQNPLDLNKDGTFNVVDLLFMLTELFSRENPDVSYLDVNKDSYFNVHDLLFMLNALF